ncbi:hypothetical protein GCM10010869_35460 [Mesorhizobium tianshanense]|nr:hypothetical protein GCM10010869_35460 [Mesorhizobium tianshanense]
MRRVKAWRAWCLATIDLALRLDSPASSIIPSQGRSRSRSSPCDGVGCAQRLAWAFCEGGYFSCALDNSNNEEKEGGGLMVVIDVQL